MDYINPLAPNLMHTVMLTTLNVDCCLWQVMATVMQPFKLWAAAVFCKAEGI